MIVKEMQNILLQRTALELPKIKALMRSGNDQILSVQADLKTAKAILASKTKAKAKAKPKPKPKPK